MNSHAKSPKRTGIEWERLVRKSIADLRSRKKRLEIIPGNLSLVRPQTGEPFDYACWKNQAFSLAPFLESPERGHQALAASLLSRLNSACAHGHHAALDANLDEDQTPGRVERDGEREEGVNAFECVLATLAQGSRQGSGFQLRGAVHAFVESLASGFSGNGERLLEWHAKMARKYSRASVGYLPQAWPSNLAIAEELTRLFIAQSCSNKFFLATMLFPNETHAVKAASQRKNIDTHGLHSFIKLCAHYCAVDDELYSTCAARAIDFAKANHIPLREPRIVRLSYDIVEISLAQDIERGLLDAVYDHAQRGHPNWNPEKAQIRMAALCAAKGLLLDDQGEARFGEALTFRAALESHKDASEISKALADLEKTSKNDTAEPKAASALRSSKKRI